MKVPEYMKGERHALSVTMVGCGGTGSVLLQHLARINTSLIAQGKHGIIVTCVDDDLVTESNLGRQLFTRQDIGRPKAVVMVERINRFYGTNWVAIAARFDEELTIRAEFPGNILISCVDTVAARRIIYHYYSNHKLGNEHEHIKNLFWIDTGNDKSTGQVIMTSVRDRDFDMKTILDEMATHEVLSDTPSCSLAEALDRQSLFINSSVALETAGLVWDLTQKESIVYRGCFINLNKQKPITKLVWR